ncbi:structural molecule [Castilleja foliolosa]|uniref:Structural molecule n=1 Tax=Castilleja foliolosa TaxID=1961234 RepID=A0ABD3CNY8_9LAMI
MNKFNKFVAENLMSAVKNLGGESRVRLHKNFPAPETTAAAAVNWLKKIFSPETRAEFFSHLENVLSWFSQWLSAVKDFGRHALAWLDRVFPPGTSLQNIKRWLILALLFLVVAVVLLVAVWVCFNRCPFVLRWIVSAVRPIVSAVRRILMRIWAYGRFPCRGAGRGAPGAGVGTVKLMKAPGRNLMIPRSLFENDPKSYFLNLRASPGDHLW